METRKNCPRAVEAILSKHYTVDYIDSMKLENEIEEVISQDVEIGKKASFILRGWIYRSAKTLETITAKLKPASV